MRYGLRAGDFTIWQADQDTAMVLHHMPVGQHKPIANERSRRDHIGSLDADHPLRPGADRGTSLARCPGNPAVWQNHQNRKPGQQTKGQGSALHMVSSQKKEQRLEANAPSPRRFQG